MITAIESLVMTQQEAQEWKLRVKEQANQLRIVLYEGYKRQVWIPLGHANWSECIGVIANEFGFSERQIWRLHTANQIQENLLTDRSVDVIPEWQLRPLASLAPEQQREAWAIAVQTAPDGKVTASHVERIVASMKTPALIYERTDQGEGIVKCSSCNKLYDGTALQFCPYCAYTPEQRMQYLQHEQDRHKDIDVHFSSKTDDWSTPQLLFDMLNSEFNFALDVCASEQNHKCKRYYAESDNGLTKNWRGVCWMNPPYGDVIAAWVEKAFQSALDGATVVCLVPARTDTRWWWDFCIHGEVRFLKGRLKFNDAGSAPFPSAIVVFHANLPKKNRRVIWWDKWSNNESSV